MGRFNPNVFRVGAGVGVLGIGFFAVTHATSNPNAAPTGVGMPVSAEKLVQYIIALAGPDDKTLVNTNPASRAASDNRVVTISLHNGAEVAASVTGLSAEDGAAAVEVDEYSRDPDGMQGSSLFKAVIEPNDESGWTAMLWASSAANSSNPTMTASLFGEQRCDFIAAPSPGNPALYNYAYGPGAQQAFDAIAAQALSVLDATPGKNLPAATAPAFAASAPPPNCF